MAEALSLLADPGAKPLAGGMSLIPMMKLRLSAPETLVDLSRIAGLNGISEVDGELRIGALATHAQVASNGLVRSKCPLLAETAAMIGDVQVRNMGTMGGSLAHADPAADYPAAMQALEAKITISSTKGERTVSAKDFFVDTFTTALEPGELVTAVSVPQDGNATGTSYQKLLQPASGFAVVGIAVRLRKQGDAITFARVGVTGLSPNSFRAAKVEEALLAGKSVEEASALVADGVDANSDIQASAEYRKHVAAVYTARAIRAALSRIGPTSAPAA
jgi:carbon-monoxide dehydrogenase medium subunit